MLRSSSKTRCSPLTPHLWRRFADYVADMGVEEGEFLAAVAAREDGAVMALAEDTASRQQMLLACTHLYWSPHFPDVKAAQASLLVKQVKRGIKRPECAWGRTTQFVMHCCSLTLTSLYICRSSVLVPSTDCRERTRCCWEATSTVCQLSQTTYDASCTSSQRWPRCCLCVAGLARKWKSDPFDNVPEGEAIISGAYELLSTGKLPVSSSDHPSRRRKGDTSKVLFATAQATAGTSSSYNAALTQCVCMQAMLDTGIALTSAYAACLGREPPITNNTATFRGALDYIWFGGADEFSVSSVLELPYADSALRPEDVQLAPIPDERFPSDHLAIAARLQLATHTGTAPM